MDLPSGAGRNSLTIQGTQVWPLVQEDSTRHGATKPVCHSYWTQALEPLSAPLLQRLKPAYPRAHQATTTKPVCRNCWSLHVREPALHNKESHSNVKPTHHNWIVAFPQLEKDCAQQRKTQRNQINKWRATQQLQENSHLWRGNKGQGCWEEACLYLYIVSLQLIHKTSEAKCYHPLNCVWGWEGDSEVRFIFCTFFVCLK